MEFFYGPSPYDEDRGDQVWFRCPHVSRWYLLPTKGDDVWTLESKEPLTVTPSILMVNCGCHGFITEGKWVKA